jgi:hypothetical protein
VTTDKRDLPLTLIQEFKQLKYDCADIQIQHADILGVQFEPFSIFLHDSSSSGKFYFNITQPILDANTKRSTVHLTFKPRGVTDPREYSMTQLVSDVAQLLANWIALVRAYNEISMDVNDRFLEEYETTFFADYKILGPDADTKPFDDRNQKLLEYTLEGFEEAIEVMDVPMETKQDILKDTSELKNRIPSLTKNQVVRGVANILAKIKLKGYDFATAFNEELPKTIAKIFAEKGVNLVLEQLPKLLHHFLA